MKTFGEFGEGSFWALAIKICRFPPPEGAPLFAAPASVSSAGAAGRWWGLGFSPFLFLRNILGIYFPFSALKNGNNSLRYESMTDSRAMSHLLRVIR